MIVARHYIKGQAGIARLAPGGGIRTRGGLLPPVIFQVTAIGHSATPPLFSLLTVNPFVKQGAESN